MRHLVIFKEDTSIFKKMVKTIKKRGFKRCMLTSPKRPCNKNNSAKKFREDRSNTCNTKCEIMNHDSPETKADKEISDHTTEVSNFKVEFTNYFSNFVSEVQKTNIGTNVRKKLTKIKPKIFIQRSSEVVSPKVRFKSIDATFKYQSSKNKSIKILETENNIKNQTFEEIKEIEEDSNNIASLILKRPIYDENIRIPKRKILNKLNTTITKVTENQRTRMLSITSPIRKQPHVGARQRFISPDERLQIAYSPIQTRRKTRFKQLSGKLNSPIKPIILYPNKNKPSSNTVTTNCTSGFINSCKSVCMSS